MAKTKVQEWDGTASNNTDIDSVNIAENCSPAGINDAIREVMAHIATALSGADDKIITGTPGTTGQLSAWNVDGDLIAATAINSLAIGNTTPAVGAFTTLSASGTLTAAGSFAFGGTTFTGVTGSDVTFVSGTAGTDGNLVQWNTDGDAVDGPDVETTITDTDSALPTSGAVVDYVATQVTGVGQTWQDVSASRAVSTSYQNTTGRPIQVCIGSAGGSGQALQVSSDNSTWITLMSFASGPGNLERQATAFTVPDDWYYRCNGGGTPFSWVELR